jgi:hypothetical protein
MGVTYLRTPCRPPCWFIILYICYTTKLFIILANMHVRHTRVYKNISNAMKELIELSIYNKVRWQMLDWFDHVMSNKFQIVCLLWCYITPIVSYLLFIILFFYKNWERKRENKSNVQSQEREPEKDTWAGMSFTGKGFHLSDGIFFSGKRFHLAEKHGREFFFSSENWCRNRATLG